MKEKIINLKELSKIFSELRSEGKKIVHCHGVFDLLHIGHIKHFEEAKTFYTTLITPERITKNLFWKKLILTYSYWKLIKPFEKIKSICFCSPFLL